MIAALLLALNLASMWRESNSHAANAKGVAAFQQKKYADAASAFTKQSSFSHSPRASFNLGTSQIAAGNRTVGSNTLSKALDDPALRADTFFNRGNSALAAKAYDYAIHDYTEALRVNPRDAGAKRNLEIALQARAAQRQSGGSKRDSQGSSSGQKPQQPQPSSGREERAGDTNAEALLRSVQQQEQEELSRMHRARPNEGRVGW